MALFGRPSQRDDQRAEAYRQWLSRRHPYAIASFVLGIISMIEFGVLVVFGIGGIVMGMMALWRLRDASSNGGDAAGGTEPMRGHRLAWAGIALSVLSLILAMVIYRLPAARR